MARRQPQATRAIPVLFGRTRLAGAALAAGCGLFAGCGETKRDVPAEKPSPRVAVVACATPTGKPGPVAQPRLELYPANASTLSQTRQLIRDYLADERPVIARGSSEPLPIVPAPTMGVELIRESVPAQVEIERSEPTPTFPPPRVTMTVERTEVVEAPKPRVVPPAIEVAAAPRLVHVIAVAPHPRAVTVEVPTEPAQLPIAITAAATPVSTYRPIVPGTIPTFVAGHVTTAHTTVHSAVPPAAASHTIEPRAASPIEIHTAAFTTLTPRMHDRIRTVAMRPTEVHLVHSAVPSAPVKPFAALIKPGVSIPTQTLVKSNEPPKKLPRQVGAEDLVAKPSGLPKQAGYGLKAPHQTTGNKPPRSANAPVTVITPGNKPPKLKSTPVPVTPTAAQVPQGVPAELLRPLPPKEDEGVVTVGGVSLTLPKDPVKPDETKPETTKVDVPKIEIPRIEPTKPELLVSKPKVGPVVGATPMVTVEPGITLPLPPLVQVPPLKVNAPNGEPTSLMLVAAPQPLPFPSAVPAAPGAIDVGGVPMTYDALSAMVGGQLGGCGGGGCSTCGGGGCPPGRPCAAGKPQCEPFPAKTIFGRAIGLMYENICCPDPCYQGKWEAITANQFFTDAPRPVAQQTIRWDYAHLALFPDRGEYFWARADGNGKGPKPNPPAPGIPDVDYHDLVMFAEMGKGAFSTTIAVPYRSVNPGIYAESAAGFGDMSITTKTLLFDSEMFMLSFLMKTTMPAGNFRKGLGVGHVSLEPSAVAGLRFGPRTYGVAQLAEWIPIAGDPDYAGAALRWNFALNHVLWQPIRDVQMIGTLEVIGFSFQDGAYTDPILGPDQKLSGQSFVSLAPSARLYYCDKFDMGMAYAQGVTGKYYAHSQIRMEFRYRY